MIKLTKQTQDRHKFIITIYDDIMHCDDKRMLYVLKEEIEKMWNKLKESDFQDMDSLKKLDESVRDYHEYKRSVN